MVRQLLTIGSAVAVLVHAVPAASQDAKPSASTPLKVQVVLSRYDGDK